MKQVFLRDAQAVVEDVPAPCAGEGEVLIKVGRSCISTGTELSGIAPAPAPVPETASELPSKEKPLWKRILTEPEMWIRAVKDPRKIVRFFWRLFRSVLKKRLRMRRCGVGCSPIRIYGCVRSVTRARCSGYSTW